MADDATAAAPRVVRLRPSPLNSDTFAPYGQLIDPSPDGAEYGSHDAQLQLPGIPRFYVMHLEKTSLSFDKITHHASVTQCLGSIGGLPWYIGVVQPSIVDNDHLSSSSKQDVQRVEYGVGRAYEEAVHSKAGHYYIPPLPANVKIFRVEGPRFLKLHVGTWHVGPLFKQNSMDFFNLELSNTNVVDHTTYAFKKVGVTFEIDD
ncbi:hypothetical protein O6H91_06G000500 [Diphasiastrum complanatum]|uniref:Uncharacterized protein n=1 Tax=Diphasiastrum complanatum TaxID=34168 RepID=A0ACC2DAB3_DIPCM|nr:hypothetical protein O6H91_06G000500 [Diphasiastrum complanatum]